ncbi:hypothetical protein MRB53_029387 [Persea americana]|uniref:Uncharacterized protein n=1 Tax=Persea americana TaxID=3435 RepID=A0ACC2KIF7_PERAE|nr:hypothetical protein MRB53_029387 [Persea americana]
MGRHLPSENTARPDRYGRSFMAIGLLIYGDKRCALSSLYASRLRAWKVRKGCCPFHLLLPVRVWSDGTSPHLPPLTERMNEEHSPIYAWGQSHDRCRFYRLQFGAVCGNPEQKACKRHASENQKRRRTLQGQGIVRTAYIGAESSTSTPSAEEVWGEVSHCTNCVAVQGSDHALPPRRSTSRATPP